MGPVFQITSSNGILFENRTVTQIFKFSFFIISLFTLLDFLMTASFFDLNKQLRPCANE